MEATTTICAWCTPPSEDDPQEGQSHGICENHRDEMLANYYLRKFDEVPSYVEQQAALFAAEDIAR